MFLVTVKIGAVLLLPSQMTSQRLTCSAMKLGSDYAEKAHIN